MELPNRPTKVRPLCYALCLLALGGLGLLGAGCEWVGGGGTAQSRQFGAPYEITLNRVPAEPDEPPHLEADTLVAQVAYSGGCEDHDFTLRYRADADTSRLWLHHDARGDACEARVHDALRLPVPQQALQAPTVVLLNPQGGAPFMLRWGR